MVSFQVLCCSWHSKQQEHDICFGSPCLPSSTGVTQGFMQMLCIQWICINTEEPQVWKTWSFIVGSKQICVAFASGREIIFNMPGRRQTYSLLQKTTLSSKVICFAHNFVQIKIISVFGWRTWRNIKDPWRVILQNPFLEGRHYKRASGRHVLTMITFWRMSSNTHAPFPQHFNKLSPPTLAPSPSTLFT